DLGALSPSAINNAGQIAGTANSRAVLWQDGTLTDLGTAGAGQAYGLNDAGQVVGRGKGINNSGNWQAFLWDSASGLRFLGQAGYDTTAFGVSSSGQVTGTIDRYWYGGLLPQAFVWDQSGGLRTFGAGSEARAINPSGQVAGWLRSS